MPFEYLYGSLEHYEVSYKYRPIKSHITLKNSHHDDCC
jgi:hypothetical protein